MKVYGLHESEHIDAILHRLTVISQHWQILAFPRSKELSPSKSTWSTASEKVATARCGRGNGAEKTWPSRSSSRQRRRAGSAKLSSTRPYSWGMRIFWVRYFSYHKLSIVVQYSSPSLIRPPYLPRKCGHIREVRGISKYIDSSSGKDYGLIREGGLCWEWALREGSL